MVYVLLFIIVCLDIEESICSGWAYLFIENSNIVPLATADSTLIDPLNLFTIYFHKYKGMLDPYGLITLVSELNISNNFGNLVFYIPIPES